MLLLVLLSCRAEETPARTANEAAAAGQAQSPAAGQGQAKITVSFDFDGSNASSWLNIYVIWLENSAGEIQNLFVCRRLLDGSITDFRSALPFWQLNRYAGAGKAFRDEVDAVTGPTEANTDFTLTADIRPSLGDRFTLYFEIDQAFNFNDWFPGSAWDMRDQPSVVYAADIDLASGQNRYDLKPLGFVPMYDLNGYGNFTLTTGDRKALETGTLRFARGEIFPDMRYITHGMKRENGEISFGEEDRSQSAVRSVAGISAAVERK